MPAVAKQICLCPAGSRNSWQCWQGDVSRSRILELGYPDVGFAVIGGRSVPCLEIGGDFFDVALTTQGLALIVADVSGKGISAALLASTLQGLIYSQLVANVPLVQIAAYLSSTRSERTHSRSFTRPPITKQNDHHVQGLSRE